MGETPAHQADVEGEGKDTITLELPVQKPDAAVPVIELILN